VSVRDKFDALLARSSTELFEDNPDRMANGGLLSTPSVIADRDLELFFAGIDNGLIQLERGGRFNTKDRPTPGGRWGLLSRTRNGGWYNAEYLPQLAAYVELISGLEYPTGRVFFELPDKALQLDLAAIDDDDHVVVLGEAKRESPMLDRIAKGVVERFGSTAPTEDSKKRGDEVRQLAWRLWTTRAPYLWLVGPGARQGYACSYGPLRLERLAALPKAQDLGLAGMSRGPLEVPDLRGRSKQ
jgi:hypothetical protein